MTIIQFMKAKLIIFFFCRTLIHISAENMLNHKVIKLEVVNEKAK